MSNSSMSTSGASYMCTSGDSLINSSYGSVQPQELLARFVCSLFGKKYSPSFYCGYLHSCSLYTFVAHFFLLIVLDFIMKYIFRCFLSTNIEADMR